MKQKAREEPPPMTEYIFAFEILRQYPTVRSFIIKAPLNKSFKDMVKDLFGSPKKR